MHHYRFKASFGPAHIFESPALRITQPSGGMFAFPIAVLNRQTNTPEAHSETQDVTADALNSKHHPVGE